jgi:hypothetical protein
MAALVSPTVNQEQFLTALQTAIFKTALATTVMRLYKNNIVAGPGSVFADFTEADFTGYTADTIVAWLAPSIDPISGRFEIMTPGFSQFLQSGTTIINTVYGWYLEDGSSHLLAAGTFDTPIQMDTTGKQIALFPKIRNSGIDGPDPYED